MGDAADDAERKALQEIEEEGYPNMGDDTDLELNAGETQNEDKRTLILRFHYEDKNWLLIDSGHDDEYDNDRFYVVHADSLSGVLYQDLIPVIKPQ